MHFLEGLEVLQIGLTLLRSLRVSLPDFVLGTKCCNAGIVGRVLDSLGQSWTSSGTNPQTPASPFSQPPLPPPPPPAGTGNTFQCPNSENVRSPLSHVFSLNQPSFHAQTRDHFRAPSELVRMPCNARCSGVVRTRHASFRSRAFFEALGKRQD